MQPGAAANQPLKFGTVTSLIVEPEPVHHGPRSPANTPTQFIGARPHPRATGPRHGTRPEVGRRGATSLCTPCSATGSSSAPPPSTPPPQRCLHSASASSRSPRPPRSPPSTSKSSAAGSPAATASRASPSPPPTLSSSSRSRRLAPPGRA